MDRESFSKIRHHLGKTQRQLARLLGTSSKTIQSFEQGWRNIFVHAERQVLLLLAPERSRNKKTNLVGQYESALRRPNKIVPHGNFELSVFAGLLVGRSARGRCKRVGSRRWNCAENAKYFDPCCVFERIVASYQTAGQLEISKQLSLLALHHGISFQGDTKTGILTVEGEIL